MKSHCNGIKSLLSPSFVNSTPEGRPALSSNGGEGERSYRPLPYAGLTRMKIKPINRLWSVFLFLAPLMALAQDGASTNNAPTAIPTVTNTASAIPGNLARYLPDDKYKLRAGDRVSLQILEDREPPKSLFIADSGELDAPYIGRIQAADKTCRQLAAETKTLLEKEYYYRATVVLALDAANKVLGRIYIWGQVRNQGPIDLAVNENLTAARAILRAGGFADFANRKKVKVIRAGAGNAAKQVFELNLGEVLEGGKTENDLLLQPDDLVLVPARLLNF
jgi:protein involved in polysaccharide export with SLBB domain